MFTLGVVVHFPRARGDASAVTTNAAAKTITNPITRRIPTLLFVVLPSLLSSLSSLSRSNPSLRDGAKGQIWDILFSPIPGLETLAREALVERYFLSGNPGPNRSLDSALA